MDSNFGWTEEGLQLLAQFKRMIDGYGGNEELIHKIEVEWLRQPGMERYRDIPKANDHHEWKSGELKEAMIMRRKGMSYKSIGSILGRSTGSVSSKFDHLRRIGQLTQLGEWVE